MEFLTISGLSVAAFVTCFFCAMAGSGSGLILVPLLILSGLTPVQAIAIHKFEALWTVVSGWRYYKEKAFLRLDFLWYLALGVLGTLIGARAIHFVPNATLQIGVGILIVLVALFIGFSAKNESEEKEISLLKRGILIACMFFFGVYEGTFGSGNGFFIAALFFTLIGSKEHETVGMITILAAFWNIAATLMHFTYGSLLWHYALPMGGAAMIGAWFGAGYALKVRNNIIRKVIFVISLLGGGALLLQMLFFKTM